MAVSSSTVSSDQRKFLADKLIARATNRLVAASLCEKVKHQEGSGLTAYFVRYDRQYIPLTTLTEGTTPSTENTMAVTSYSVTLDQWGDFLTITDVAKLTTAHPLVQQATELLADNAQRVIDREVQLVWMAGTNVQYGDGSVTTRATITAAMKISDTVLHKARITMQNNGAPERGGPEDMDHKLGQGGANKIGSGSYIAVCGPEVMADVLATGTSFGSLASVAAYQSKEILYNGEFAQWLGFRWVMSNFVPKFSILGNTTAAVTSGNDLAGGTGTGGTGPAVTAVDGGGSLTSATAHYFKVTRIDRLRGFEEAISIRHSMSSTATGNNESFTFDFTGQAAGYAWKVYFGTVDADASLKLVNSTPALAGETVTVTAVSSSTITAPANVNTTGTPTIYPVFIHAARSCQWVGLQDLQVYKTAATASDSDPLAQRQKFGYKFLAKSIVCDQTRLLRLEVASTY